VVIISMQQKQLFNAKCLHLPQPSNLMSPSQGFVKVVNINPPAHYLQER
jgi:hypothetical protein